MVQKHYTATNIERRQHNYNQTKVNEWRMILHFNTHVLNVTDYICLFYLTRIKQSFVQITTSSQCACNTEYH